THTFSTRFWEADFQSLRVVSLESFTEKGIETEVKRSNTLQAVVDELSGIAPRAAMAPVAGSAGIGHGKRVLRVTKEDLTLLRAAGLAGPNEKALERQDAAERSPVLGLNPEAAVAAATELRSMHGKVVERALNGLFSTAMRATAEEQDRLRGAFALVLTA